MNNEIVQSLHCVVVRNGIEIWIPSDKMQAFDNAYKLARKNQELMYFGEERINPADVVGVFKADTMSDLTRRKNGQWKCQHGNWHDRNEKCECISAETKEFNEALNRAITDCGKCQNGWVTTERGVRRCDCVLKVQQKYGKQG